MENTLFHLTNAELERLAILSEECGEVIQVIGKIIRHGYESHHPDGGPNNRELLEKELGDVRFIINLLSRNNDVSSEKISECMIKKAKSIQQYLHHQ